MKKLGDSLGFCRNSSPWWHRYFFLRRNYIYYIIIYIISYYIYIYIYIILYTKTAAKEAVLLPVKSSSDDDLGFRYGFGAEASLPLTQGAPAVSHNTTRLYRMVLNLYECHIRSDAVTGLFWIFFYIFPLLCWCKSDFG